MARVLARATRDVRGVRRPMSAHSNREDVHRRLQERYRRLAEARTESPAAAVAARFTEIDGATLGGIVSVELFTTVIPLIIIGFDYLSGFAENAVREHS